MSYEIRKVANGYMVFPTNDYRSGDALMSEKVHVFESWDKASEWLRQKFAQVSGG